MKATGRFTLDGQPLKRNFIEIRVKVPIVNIKKTVAIALTDDNGDFSVEVTLPSYMRGTTLNKFIAGIHCHNAAIRVLTTPVEQEITNGATFNLDSQTLGASYDHFRILAQCIDVYDRVWRQFRPYNSSQRGDFPLKKLATPEATLAEGAFPEIQYPAFTFGLSYVEPADATNSLLPLVHVEDKQGEFRLFGINGSQPTLLPHELGHVFHFAGLDKNARVAIEGTYLAFLVTHISNATHAHNKRTSPFIAFIEAIGIFSERFYFFSKLVRPNLAGIQLRQAFWRDELSTQSLSSILGNEYTNVGTLDAQGNLSSTLIKSRDVEGRVYGAVFLHLSKKIGLKSVMSLVMQSQATTFDELKAYITGLGDAAKTSAINEVENTWFN